ncbi:hypothetical protein DL767_008858 [Monosporascus sp. MG133]|nr:hypothetical protein DL767_008858 [Monosporascus sp. MG133]
MLEQYELGVKSPKLSSFEASCSRNGKSALIAGAFDDRIALTIPQEGGSGGPGSWRLAAYMKGRGINVEHASQIVTGDQWYAPYSKDYVEGDLAE